MVEEMLSPLLTTELGRRLSIGFLLCFMILTLFLVIKIPLNVYSDFLLTKQKNEMSAVVIASSATNAKLIDDISKHHLFGNTAAIVQTIVPVTSLQLKLVGIVQSKPDQLSRAIISEAGLRGKIYKLNDQLPSGARISAITADSVILDNAGRMEKLPLQRVLVSFQGIPKKLLAEN